MRKVIQEPSKRLIQKIKELSSNPDFYKHDRLVKGVIQAIDEKIIQENDRLPSVNTLIKELHFSRSTVVKALNELCDRRIIASQQRLGYYVAGEDKEKTLKVALIMYNLDTFEEQFYRNFRKELGQDVLLNIYFHHGNIDTFETTISQINGKYDSYVIAPVPHAKTKNLLESIPKKRLLMFDRYEPLDGEFNHITQEFEQSTYRVLSDLRPQIGKFKKIIFYHSDDSLDPKEMVKSFKKFLSDFRIKGGVVPDYIPGTLEKGNVYFTLDNFVLWEIIKEIKSKGLVPGKDVGILSHNDEPAKEIIGITTFSADFSLMGKKAGQAVMNRQPIRETMPMQLERRSTL